MEIWAPPKLHIPTVPGVNSQRDQFVADMQEQTDVCVHPDPDRLGAMENTAASIRCASRDRAESPWHFVVQDDHYAPAGWQQHLERACRYSPAPVLTVSWGNTACKKGYEQGVPYMRGSGLVAGAGLALHESILAELAEFCTMASEIGFRSGDRAVAAWAKSRGIKPAVVSRSIFVLLDVPSLLKHPPNPPGYTIENTDQPQWAARPATMPLNGSLSKSEYDWLMDAWRSRAV